MGMNYLKGETFRKNEKVVKILEIIPIGDSADHAREEGEIPSLNYRVSVDGAERIFDYMSLERLLWSYQR